MGQKSKGQAPVSSVVCFGNGQAKVSSGFHFGNGQAPVSSVFCFGIGQAPVSSGFYFVFVCFIFCNFSLLYMCIFTGKRLKCVCDPGAAAARYQQVNYDTVSDVTVRSASDNDATDVKSPVTGDARGNSDDRTSHPLGSEVRRSSTGELRLVKTYVSSTDVMLGFVFFAFVRLLYVSLRWTLGLALQFSDSSDGTPSAVDNTMKVDVTVHAACDVFNTTNDVLNPADDIMNLSDDVVYPTDEAMNSSYDASKVADGSASKTDGRFAAAAAGARNVIGHAAEPEEPMTGEGEWRRLIL